MVSAPPTCDFYQTDAFLRSKYPEFGLSLHATIGTHPYVAPPSRPPPIITQLQGLSDKKKKKFIPMFKLGNDRITGDVVQAAGMLLNREYSYLHSTKQNGPTFIPIFFIPKLPILVDELSSHQKEIVETEGGTTDNTSPQKIYKDNTVFLEKDKKKIWKNIGDDAERNVFRWLQDVLNNDPDAADVIVIHEFHTGRRSTRKHGLELNEEEHDFLIISPRRKVFLPFEVKSTLTVENQHKAAIQLQQSQKMLQDFWYDIFEKEGWSICPTVYFKDKTGANLCKENCDKWALFEEADFQRWWKHVKNNFKPLEDDSDYQTAREHCLQVVQQCLFNLHISVPKGGPLTTSGYVAEVEKLMEVSGSTHQILFWNANQLKLMSGDDNKFVLFCSPYGTGKSALMRSKCEEEAQKNFNEKNGKKCLYVYGGMRAQKRYTLLQIKHIRQWKSKNFFHNVDILSYYDIAVSQESLIVWSTHIVFYFHFSEIYIGAYSLYNCLYL